MSRNESLILVKDGPTAVATALDGILGEQGLVRTATRTIAEDFAPMLYEQGGPLAFVLSEPHDDWLVCYTSLSLDVEWDVAEALAQGLEQPVICALFAANRDVFAYRYWTNGELRAEALPTTDDPPLDEKALLNELERIGVPIALVDDQTDNFANEHLVLGYQRTEHKEQRTEDGVTVSNE